MGVVDREAGLVDPLAQVVAHAALPRQLFEQGPVAGGQPKLPVDPLQPDPAIAADQLAQVGWHVRRNRKLGITSPAPSIIASADMPGRRRVPERERGQTVGVDVLGALLQLGERRDRISGLGVQRIVDLQQDRAIPLHDQRIGGIVLHGLLAGSGMAGRRTSPLP